VHHFRVAKKQQHQRADEGRKAVFRIPTTAYLAIGLLTICVTPIALGEIGGFQWLYVFPLALLVFVARTRTVATREGLHVRTVFGQRELPWSSLKGLAIHKARVRAVLGDDTQVSLPTVRTRHLPVMALVSEGKIKDPSGVLSDEELAGRKSGAGAQGGSGSAGVSGDVSASVSAGTPASGDAPSPAAASTQDAAPEPGSATTPDSAPATTPDSATTPEPNPASGTVPEPTASPATGDAEPAASETAGGTGKPSE